MAKVYYTTSVNMKNKNTVPAELAVPPELTMQQPEQVSTPMSVLIRESIEDTGDVEAAPHTVAVAGLMRQHLVDHAGRKGAKAINTAERFHDWVDVFNAHEAMYTKDHYGHNLASHILFSSDTMLNKLLPGLGRDETAVELVATDINSLSEHPNREMRKAMMRTLDLTSMQMASFVAENLDQETRDGLDDISWAQLELARRTLPHDPKHYEQDVPNYLSQIMHGAMVADKLLPAIRNYYAGEYPKDLLTESSRRPEYADSVSSLLMLTLKNMAKEDRNAKIMHEYLLQEGVAAARSGHVKVSAKAGDAVRPPVTAFVALANKLSPSLANATGKAYELIERDSGDMQFPRAVERIVEALYVATDSLDMSLHTAQKSKQSLECVQLINDRLAQYIAAKAEHTNSTKTPATQRNGTMPKAAAAAYKQR
jgi:hypothetical protein